ncbi:MAG: DUF1858 domain-containing protein, partial [Clostridiales bacterium]|nr:DUF1858 domain-containing protein [Clostridiales bacterium]
ELCNTYPEIKDILNSIGFIDITKPGMLNTVGKFMTIPKGATMKKLSLDTIKEALIEHGFTIIE